MKYKDKNQPIEERVKDLLSQMTIEEKIGQLIGITPHSVLDAEGDVNESVLQEKYANGLGRISQFTRASMLDVTEIPKIYNKIQKHFVENTRLGIPFMAQAECLNGYVHLAGVPFPTPIVMGSTFNPELAYEASKIIGDQAHAVGTNVGLFPVVDLSRDARYGRTHETFGEDPYLTAAMGTAEVKGFNRHQKMHACGKHFVAYSQTLGSISCASSGVNRRCIREEHAYPWEAMFHEADLRSLMCTYSAIDGIPVSVNKSILQDLLRKDLGFTGTAICDGGSIERVFEKQDIGNSYMEVGALAIKAGLSADTSFPLAYPKLKEALEANLVTMEEIDKQVSLVLREKFRLGLFDDPYVDDEAVNEYFGKGKYEDKCLEVCHEGIALLRNENKFLPWNKEAKIKIAVIGPHADNYRDLFAGYTGPATVESAIETLTKGGPGTQMGITDVGVAKKNNNRGKGNASEDFTNIHGNQTRALAVAAQKAGIDISDSNKLYHMYTAGKTIFEAIRDKACQAEVVTVKGSDILTADASFDEAVNAAQNADVVVLAVGGKCGGLRTSLSGETRERANIDLPSVQKELAEAVLNVNDNVVVVVTSGRPMAIGKECEKAKAVIQFWNPGSQGGIALADILFGDVNPSGKLPVTVPITVGQTPIFYSCHYGSGYSNAGTSAFGVDYVDCPSTPLYPFGYGLSYTEFAFTDFQVKKPCFSVDEDAVVSVKVKNVGDVAGKEVVQLYFNIAGRRVTRPSKQLVGFEKIHLEPNEEKTVTFHVPFDIVGYLNENDEFLIDSGKVRVYLGNNSYEPQCEGEFMIEGTKRLDYTRKHFSTVTVQ